MCDSENQTKEEVAIGYDWCWETFPLLLVSGHDSIFFEGCRKK